MQRSNLVIKIISGVLFLAMLAYIAFTLIDWYNSGAAGQRTVLAVEQTVNESCSARGLMVREERVVSGGGAMSRITADDGSKVHAGETVAAVYDSEQALADSRELESLLQQRDRLEDLLSFELAGQNSETAAQSIQEGLLRLSQTVNSGSFTDLDLICDEVRAMVVTSGTGSYAQLLAETQAQIETLQASASGAVDLITAPEAGLFSAQCDGLETLQPEDLEALSPSSLNQLMEQTASFPADAAGKLITGLRWYFAMTVTEEDAARTYVGDESLRLHFPRLLEEDVSVRVEQISASENGQCLIVLSSDREMEALSDVRVATGELIFSTVTGIRVPREAARVDEDGQAYVYILVGIQARRKNIDIIAETEDYYLVAYNSADENSLRLGNEIMVNYSGLYEGKVIE